MKRTAHYSRALVLLGALLLPLLALEPLEAQSYEGDSLRGGSQATSVLTVPEPQSRMSNVTSHSQYLGIGGMRLGNTYLTPLNYGGRVYSYLSQSSHLGYKSLKGETEAKGSLFAYTPRTTDPRWLKHTLLGVDLALTLNPAGNATIYSLGLRYDWGYLRRVMEGKAGRLYLGGSLVGFGGVAYSTRNGNNPVALDAALSVGLSALYSYRLGTERFPLLLKTYAHTDLLGLAFAQEFGESFFELYYYSKPSRRISLTHPFSSPELYLLSTLDVPLLDYLTLSVGYRWDYRRTELHQIRAYRHQHSLLVGVTTHFLPLQGRRTASKYSSLVPF